MSFHANEPTLAEQTEKRTERFKLILQQCIDKLGNIQRWTEEEGRYRDICNPIHYNGHKLSLIDRVQNLEAVLQELKAMAKVKL